MEVRRIGVAILCVQWEGKANTPASCLAKQIREDYKFKG